MMAIEGPLRELGIHDVFQLLDLSRKTGTLHVRSTLRDNEGTMFFGTGRVIYAAIKSNPHPLGDLLLRQGKVSEADLERALTMQGEKHGSLRMGEILVEIGAISRRELERQMRFQVEEVVFELLSWNEGFFSFEEGDVDDLLPEATVSISTESLLMEGARRIDEWSRIATRIPDLRLVPRLSGIPQEHPPQLDLLPNEWEVLAMVDGTRTVREMAQLLAMSDFEVARVLYGLVCTAVVEVDTDAIPRGATPPAGAPLDEIQTPIIMHESEALSRRDPVHPSSRNGDDPGAAEAPAPGLHSDTARPEAHLELGYARARAGELGEAIASWSRYLELDPSGDAAQSVRRALEHASRLNEVLREHYDG
jgi:hypothetical protein